MKLQIACFTASGEALACKIKELCKQEEAFSESEIRNFSKWKTESLRSWTERGFQEKNVLLFIGACGIAVRSIAPFVKSKLTDPPVLVMDEKSRYVIPLLSCHIGEGGKIAERLAKLTGAEAVMTTASDVNHVFAVDTFAKENHLLITDMGKAKKIAALAAAGEEITLYYPKEEEAIESAIYKLEEDDIKGLHKVPYTGLLPEEYDIRECKKAGGGRKAAGEAEEKTKKTENKPTAAVIISPAIFPKTDAELTKRAVLQKQGEAGKTDHTALSRPVILQLVPRDIIIGAGCKKGKPAQELLSFIRDTLKEQGILPEAVCCIASIDKKKDEAGLVWAAKQMGVSFTVFSAGQLSAQEGEFSASDFVEKEVGVDNVCERAACAAGARRLLMRKKAGSGMTLAIGIK